MHRVRKDEIKRILSSEKTILIKSERWNDGFIQGLKQNPLVNRVVVTEKEITIIVAKEVNLFSALMHLAEESEIELNSVEIKTPTLEDVFLHLTGRALRD